MHFNRIFLALLFHEIAGAAARWMSASSAQRPARASRLSRATRAKMAGVWSAVST